MGRRSWTSSIEQIELVHCSFNELPWNELNDYDELMSWWLNEDSDSHSDKKFKKIFLSEKDQIFFFFEKESFEFAILHFTMWKRKRERK